MLIGFADHVLILDAMIGPNEWYIMMIKDDAIGVRVASSVKQAAEKAAAAERRSVSSLMEKLLYDHLISEGYVTLDDSDQTKRGDIA